MTGFSTLSHLSKLMRQRIAARAQQTIETRTQQRMAAHAQKTKVIRYRWMISAFLCLFCFSCFLSPLSMVMGTDLPEPTNVSLSDYLPEMELTASSYLFSGGIRNRILGSRDAEQIIKCPAAVFLMTCVLASESVLPNTLITISEEALALDEARIPSHLQLSSGRRYSIEYLMASVIHNYSFAAMYAIAEHVSGSVEAFVEKMNSGNSAIGLSQTTFVCDVNPAGVSGNIANTFADNSQTTLQDLGVLFRYALSKGTFREYLTTPKMSFFMEDGSYRTLINSMYSAWGLGNDDATVLGIMHVPYSSSTGTILALSSNGEFETLLLLHNVDNIALYNDLDIGVRTVYSTFTTDTLVTAGQEYADVYLEGIDMAIPVQFRNSLRYLHPQNESFLHPESTFEASGTFTLPISGGTPIGQVVFTFLDQSQLRADVVSTGDIYVRYDFYSRAVSLFQTHGNITWIIICCAVTLLFVILYKIIRKLQKTSSNKPPNQG